MKTKNNILNPIQQKVLSAIGKSDLAKFYYWTGGTALAYRYLPKRLSEDLDFFSFDLQTDENLLIEINKLKKELDIKKIDFDRNLNRQQYILYFFQTSVKLEFVFFPFKNLGKICGDKNFGIKIDSLTDIVTNKTLATFQRTEPKDIFDLYFIMQTKKFKLSRLIKNVENKFGVQINEADLVAKILREVELLENIKPLILDSKDCDIEKIKKFFIKPSMRYLRSVIL